jgi:ABC-type transport system substrate-binding protein
MRFPGSLSCLLLVLLAGCGEVWNNPYPASDYGKNILYSSFSERPKHLDPVSSYSENEALFNAQIYEAPLQYDYLKRPYQLIPRTAESLPKPTYHDNAGRVVQLGHAPVAYSVYELRIQPGILYQPHPAFARDASGRLLYHALTGEDLKRIWKLSDFPRTGTRELTAEDYVYQIKRLAHPRLHSPVFGLMSQYIVGLKEFAETLRQADQALAAKGKRNEWLDLTQYPLAGVEVVDRHTYRIKIKGQYPQFLYWLEMPFLAPVPIEADRFFAQAGMAEKNLTLDWYPIGTGPYMMTENDPNSRMVLQRNPNFRGEPYPSEGEAGDRENGLLADAGKRMPLVDTIVFSREKEGIPYWNKFLQGYYDTSGISSDSFDQAVKISVEGETTVTPEMQARGIRLETSIATSSVYLGFNWLDPVVGGLTERARKLRQAVSIAIDMEEFVSIFANGRGVPAQGPIPPGIFGYRDGRQGVNAVVYDWVDNAPKRKPVEAAKRLLVEAGYPGGRDEKSGKPLVLYLDVTGRGPDDKSRFDWYRKQLSKIDVQLEIRDTDYNRFQDKIRKGSEQMFIWGWNADYPDPENFLFLLQTTQGRTKFQGENSANYSNPEYDKLFDQMQVMENGPEREALIDRMYEILRRDTPWVWGYHPKTYSLNHAWLGNIKPNQMARNKMKYYRIDAALRDQRRSEWNAPILWPIALGALLLLAVVLPAAMSYRRRERMAARPVGLSA